MRVVELSIAQGNLSTVPERHVMYKRVSPRFIPSSEKMMDVLNNRSGESRDPQDLRDLLLRTSCLNSSYEDMTSVFTLYMGGQSA